MHEELYLPESKALKNILLVLGMLILPFSLLSFGLRNGKFFLEMQFDLVFLVASFTVSSARFLPIKEKKQLICLPYYSLLILLFLRFGTVTLFDRVISFERYLPSALLMIASFGYSFIFYFITEGKMRTKVFLWIWNILMELIALLSAAFAIPPFVVYDEITEGQQIFNISTFIVFILFNTAPLVIAFFLKDEKVKAEKKLQKANKN